MEGLHDPEAPRPTNRNAIGTQLYGPAGAAVWSAPTIDVQRHAVYVATGNSYSDPPAETSDAILAFDLATGRMLWHRQATAKDSVNVACYGADQTNCPEDHGPDSDFGQSPILVSLRSGQRVLVVGQKSGVVYALDPDQEGKILWQTRIGKGGPLGGIMWGSAADEERVYVANSDLRGVTVRIPLPAEAFSRWTLPPGKSQCRCRRSRVVTGANAALLFPQRSPQFPALFFRAGLAAIYEPMPLPTPSCFGRSTRRTIMRR